jgi:hypothetical protein
MAKVRTVIESGLSEEFREYPSATKVQEGNLAT